MRNIEQDTITFREKTGLSDARVGYYIWNDSRYFEREASRKRARSHRLPESYDAATERLRKEVVKRGLDQADFLSLTGEAAE